MLEYLLEFSIKVLKRWWVGVLPFMYYLLQSLYPSIKPSSWPEDLLKGQWTFYLLCFALLVSSYLVYRDLKIELEKIKKINNHQAAKFSEWDKVKVFKVFEVACLLCDIEPTEQMPDEAKEKCTEIITDINNGKFSDIDEVPEGQDAFDYMATIDELLDGRASGFPETKIPDYYETNMYDEIGREKLISYFAKKDIRPKFLYRTERVK